jgi:glycosyltransferase involved in cell wall biosynthesis
METLKILIFNWRDIKNPEAGGAEVFTHEVAKRFVKMGHNVTLFVPSFKGAKPRELIDGVEVLRSGSKYTVYWKAKQHYKQEFKGTVDVVIDEINTRPFMTVKFVKEPVIALIHQLAREYWFYETPFPINYIGYHFLEDRWLKNYVNVPTVTVSESTRKDLLDLGFKKVFMVPEGLNFTPLSKFPEKEVYPVVAYAGRLKKAKRPDHAIRAFKIIREKFPKAELWIIGDGPFRKYLERIAGEGVKFFRGISNEERRRLLARAWVLVNPSVREGFGLNVLEANALGTPSIAYDVTGLRDSIINGKTGLLVKEKGDIKRLAEVISMVLSDRTLRMNLSANALEYSKNFSWDGTAQEFEKILKEMVSERTNIKD